MRKKIAFLTMWAAAILMWSEPVEAKTIVFVPQDNRPVSLAYTVLTAESAGYTVLTPPDYLISGKNFFGYPDEIWKWLDANVAKADALILSTDTLVYGGLVDSRKHTISLDLLLDRVKRLQKLKKHNPNTPIYAFGTVMRSPRASGGGVEPEYYAEYGPTIFQIAALQDKLDSKGLTADEQAQLFSLTATVPVEYLQDWFNRRQKNMIVNRALIDTVRTGVFSYFALGHDDTSYLSQSAMEGRHLQKYSQDLLPTTYGSFPGADQLGLLLIARAHVDMNQLKPTFQMIYPLGGAERTMPHYEDQSIGKTTEEHILAVGGTIIEQGRPDILLALNTPLTKTTGESESFKNLPFTSASINKFVDRMETAIKSGVPVAVADVAYSNGADNILTNSMKKRDLLYKVASYNGWNTASNTVGYAIAQGILSPAMSEKGHKMVLTQQYLDNWGYQANVRKEVYRMQDTIRTDNVKYTGVLNERLEEFMIEKLQDFAEKELSIDPRTVWAKFPWGRLFETDVIVYDEAKAPLMKEIRMAREEEERKKAEAEAKEKAKTETNKLTSGATDDTSNSAKQDSDKSKQ